MKDTQNITRLFAFQNSYAQLPERFYRRCMPAPCSAPRIIAFNHALASEIGMHLEGLNNTQLAALFSGNEIPEDANPMALAYAGHQFGHFVPELGDGRALLLGEVKDAAGKRYDIQLKGSGQTPFSRRGDGRAAIGPVIREYIVSEAMHALGIKTTRSLAAVTTGEWVQRETMLPGAVLTRVAASHIRIGTFEYFAARSDVEAVRKLADYAIERHYPEANAAENPYAALLECVIDAQASLIASWMHVGFIHGVINTDNMAISGETIDYGPCAFMDYYEPMMVFSSIDRNGRYAFSNQPLIASWNLARFAETLLPLIAREPEEALPIVEPLLIAFSGQFGEYWLAGMRTKIGLCTQEPSDLSLVNDLLKLMHENAADYTNSFRLLRDSMDENNNELFSGQHGAQWLKQWRERLARQPKSPVECKVLMGSVNPAYIPRNHRIEQAIEAATEHGDFSLMQQIMEALTNPFQEQERFTDYALPPTQSERVYQTFCGT